MAFSWTCGFCNTTQTVVDQKMDAECHYIRVGESKHGSAHFMGTETICCSNPNCKELTVEHHLYAKNTYTHNYNVAEFEADKDVSVQKGLVRPQGTYVNQPDYIPIALREDYYEACKILELSPKASATLTRRCLQGMIRNFCKIKKPTLFAEIAELRKVSDEGNAPKGVTDETTEAIDHVRKVGNIGAHMEQDIDKIIDIDPGEAKSLIELVELLFEEWYVARYNRQKRLQKIKAISTAKEEQKKQPAATTPKAET